MTVSVTKAVLPPSAVVTVMVAVPSPTAVTAPDELTVATLGSLVVHVTDLLVALEGETVAVKVHESPASSSL